MLLRSWARWGLATSVVRLPVILPSSVLVTPVASHADLVFEVDQESHAYSAYLVEAGQTPKVFVIWPGRAIGAIVHDAEGVKR
ncbi:hypothetical protein EDB19DRAFT_1756954 [Suillus lakei]|nr:hypothetical protein EDB19DRAFT_1756954 [Suillus lakei]